MPHSAWTDLRDVGDGGGLWGVRVGGGRCAGLPPCLVCDDRVQRLRAVPR